MSARDQQTQILFNSHNDLVLDPDLCITKVSDDLKCIICFNIVWDPL